MSLKTFSHAPIVIPTRVVVTQIVSSQQDLTLTFQTGAYLTPRTLNLGANKSLVQTTLQWDFLARGTLSRLVGLESCFPRKVWKMYALGCIFGTIKVKQGDKNEIKILKMLQLITDTPIRKIGSYHLTYNLISHDSGANALKVTSEVNPWSEAAPTTTQPSTLGI